MLLASALEAVVSRGRQVAAARQKQPLHFPAAAVCRDDKPLRGRKEVTPDFVRQGDIYVWAYRQLPEYLAPGAQEAQLAPGTTRGSRHVLDALDGVQVFRRLRTDDIEFPLELQGPVLYLTQPRVITHPDHSHVHLPLLFTDESGQAYAIYEITYAQEGGSRQPRRALD